MRDTERVRHIEIRQEQRLRVKEIGTDAENSFGMFRETVIQR